MENSQSDIRLPRRKPLVSQTGPTEDIRFRDFGSLNMGKQSGIGPIASIVGNILAAFIVFVIWKATPVVMKEKKVVDLTYAEIKPLPPPPPPIKIVMPKLPPPKPTPPTPTPPVEVLKPIPLPPTPVAPKPVPVPVPNRPAPPKLQEAAPAPKVVPVSLARAASVPNSDPHPSAIALGRPDNPIAVSTRPATSAINLGNAGAAGMPASNTGRGPASTAVNLGSGRPNGTNMNGGGTAQVAGVRLGGVQGGTPGAKGSGVPPTTVALGQRPPAPGATTAVMPTQRAKPPQVVFQPKPQYTADATQNHIEGTISVRIHVASNGTVTVLGVVGGGLGHGLDQSALSAAQQIRFRPAVDGSGNPTDWEGVVKVQFQISE